MIFIHFKRVLKLGTRLRELRDQKFPKKEAKDKRSYLSLLTTATTPSYERSSLFVMEDIISKAWPALSVTVT